MGKELLLSEKGPPRWWINGMISLTGDIQGFRVLAINNFAFII